MRSLLALVVFAASVHVGAQDPELITPLVSVASPSNEWITPLVNGADKITPTPAHEAPVTTTSCVSAAVTVTPGVAGVSIDPYNAPDDWQCFVTFPQGGGIAIVPLQHSAAASDHKDRIVKLIVPIVVSVVVALIFLGIGLFAVRRRAQRAHKEAVMQPWFKRQGWVNDSSPNVVEISKPQPATLQATAV